MKNNYTKTKTATTGVYHWLLCALVILGLGVSNVNAQNLNTYSFAQTSGTYKQAGQGATLTTSGCYDDGNFTAISIPFTFTYHGAAFSTITASQNGFAVLGSSGSGYSALTTYANTLSPLNNDLYGCTASGADFTYNIVGGTPNRVLTLQWNNWGIYSSGANEFSFQIKLYETSNNVQFVYQNGTGTGSTSAIVGLNGATTADFQTRTTTTSWAATTAGGANSATCTVSSTVRPTNGLTFTWSSAATVAAMAFVQSTTTYVPIEGGTSVALTTTGCYDDGAFAAGTIPWSFMYHGVAQTTITMGNNGQAAFSGGSSTGYSAICSGANTLSAINNDLYGCTANGAEASYTTIGTTPNRTFICQWSNWGIYSGGLNEFSYQIRLQETTNSITFAYGPSPGTSSTTAYCGMTGATTADFLGRTTTSNWSSTTAAASSCGATCTISSTVRPANGLTFTWSPPTSVACTGTPAPGSTLSTSNSVCSGVSFTLSLSNPFTGISGLTYQWQSSPDNSSWTDISGATSSTRAQTQTTSTYYRCNVTCAGNGTGSSSSVLVAQNSPTQCYCIPVTSPYGCTDGDVIARVILNTLDNNSGTGCPSGTAGYSNYTTNTALTTTLQAGTSYGCTVYAGQYTEGYAAWIDYNDDGTFADPAEKIGFSNGQVTGSGSVGVLGSSATFNISLACNPPVGQHRLRVRCMYAVNGSGVTPCTANTYGETEDYLVTIASPPPCPTPSNLAVTNPGITSADLSWTVGCVETSWDVEFGPTGHTAGTGTLVSAGTNPFTLTTLPCGSTSEIYIRANCGGGNGVSQWFGPVSVTMGICPCSATPTPGNTLSSSSSACSGVSFTLSLQNNSTQSGLSYQWQSSSDGTNYFNISGALSATYAASQTSATYYQCNVTCSGNGTGTSTPLLVGMNTPLNCYCTPITSSSAFCCAMYVSNVTTSGGISNFNNSSVEGAGSYQNYSSTQIASQIQGFPFTITGTNNGYGMNYAVWIDFNDNGLFTDAGEQVLGSPMGNTAPGSISGTFTVSPTAPTGTHRMRVRADYYGSTYPFDPCNQLTYGETEDYGFTVLAPSAPVVSSFTPPNGCSGNTPIIITGANFYSVTGVTIGGAAVSSYTINSTTQITAILGTALTGLVSITNTYGTGNSAGTFTVDPTPAAPTVDATSWSINPGDTQAMNITDVGPNFAWYNVATGGVAITTSTLYTTPSLCVTTTYYAEQNNGSCPSTTRTAVVVNVPTISAISASPSTGLICSAGGSVNLSVGAVSGASYSWSPGTGLDNTNTNSVTASPSTTTSYTVTVSTGGCNFSPVFNVGVISGTASAPTATPSTGCFPANSSVALNSNLSAGNFGVSSIPYNLVTVPGSGVTTIALNGAAIIPQTSGSLDDGGWGGIPIGFNYNFFGTDFTSLNVGTNGLVQFGAYNSTQIAQFSGFAPFPSGSNPSNIIAWCANDLHVGNSTTGSIKCWTDGIAPTRRFVLQFTNIRQYSAGPFNTGEIILYETTGICEIHLGQCLSTNAKYTGVQNAGTIGATAPGRNGFTGTVTTPEGWRFTPPANYTYAWSTADTFSNTHTILSATNTSTISATVDIDGAYAYNLTTTNPSTNCANSSSVTFTLNATPGAPTSSDVSRCAAGPISVTATGTGAGINWYNVATGGTPLATTNTYTTNVTATTTFYVAAITGICESARTPVVVTVNAPPAITLTNPTTSFCGSSTAPVTMTVASPNDPNYVYTWTESGTTLNTNSGQTVIATVTSNSVITTGTGYTVTAVDASTGCYISAATSITDFNFPAFNASATPAVICSGTSTLDPGVSTTNFSVNSIPYAPLTAPATGVTNLAIGGVSAPGLVGSLDDGYWSNIPIPFNYNYFGTDYNSLSIGTNGVVEVGNGAMSTQFTFSNFPSPGNPCNVIAVIAQDLYFATSGTLRYWSTGSAPLRQFVIEYQNAPGFISDGFQTVQCILTETIGTVEIHVTQVSDAGHFKTIGLQNCPGTIGAAAPGRNNSNFQVSTPEAWKFTPPASYSFAWAEPIGGTTLSATNIANPVATPVTPGDLTYTVTITDNLSGCVKTDTTTVRLRPTPLDPTTPVETSTCGTGPVSLAVSTALPSETGRWYNAAVGGTLLATSLTYTPTISSTTTYYVEAFNGGCSSSGRLPVVGTFYPANTVSPIATPSSVCNGNSSALSAAAGTAGSTFAWSGSNLSSNSGASVTASNITTASDYTVTATAPVGGCTATATVSVSVIPAPSGSASDQTITSGNAASVALSGADNYSWTGSGNGAGSGTSSTISETLTNPGNATASVTTYTVTPYTVEGCPGASFTVNVTVNPLATVSANDVTVCSGTSPAITITASTGAGTTFTWTSSGDANASGFNNCSSGCGSTINELNLANLSNSVAAHVTYTIVPTFSGVQGIAFPVNVTINPLPVGTATNYTVCTGGATSIGLSSTTGGTSYAWSNNAGAGVTGATTCSTSCGSVITNTLTNVSGSAAQTVVYTIIPTANTCQGASFSSAVTVNQKNTAPTSIAATSPVVCLSSPGTILQQVGGQLGTGAVWAWYTTNTYTPASLVGTSSAADASLPVSRTVTTTYWVRAEGAAGPCTPSNTAGPTTGATVSVTTAAPVRPTTVTGPQILCAYTTPGAIATYTATAVSGATSYKWTLLPGMTAVSVGTNTVIAVTSNTVTTNNNKLNITVDQNNFINGVIYVVASNACGDSPSQQSLSLTLLPAVPGTITGPASVCYAVPTTVVYNTTAAISSAYGVTQPYFWSVPGGMNITGGQGSSAITVDVTPNTAIAGNVTVFTQNPCGQSLTTASKAVTSATAAVGAIGGNGGNDNICENIAPGTPATFTVAPVAGATSYIWGVPAGVNIIGGTGTTAITLTFTAAFATKAQISVFATNGCKNTATVYKWLYKTPNTPASISVTGASCTSGAVFTCPTVNGAGMTYTWTVPNGMCITGGQSCTKFTGTTNSITTTKPGSPIGNVTVAAVNSCGVSAARTLAISCASPIFMNDEDQEGIITTIYPNPTVGDFTIELNSAVDKDLVIEVYDILGKVIVSKTQTVTKDVITSVKTNIEGYKNGVYLVRIVDTNNNIIHTQSVVKQ